MFQETAKKIRLLFILFLFIVRPFLYFHILCDGGVTVGVDLSSLVSSDTTYVSSSDDSSIASHRVEGPD